MRRREIITLLGMAAAKAIGPPIPQAILARADEVIE